MSRAKLTPVAKAIASQERALKRLRDCEQKIKSDMQAQLALIQKKIAALLEVLAALKRGADPS